MRISSIEIQIEKTYSIAIGLVPWNSCVIKGRSYDFFTISANELLQLHGFGA